MERVRLTGRKRRRPAAKGSTRGKTKKKQQPVRGKRLTASDKMKRDAGTHVLDADLIKRFCKYALKGLPADGICDYLSISSSSYYKWMRRGQRYVEGGGEPKKWAIYGEFYQRLRRALAKYRLRTLDRMHSPGNRFWARDMTILERRDRRNFGKNELPGGSEQSFQADERFL